jgi:FMN phosphatase YigB (HAD superfamily)
MLPEALKAAPTTPEQPSMPPAFVYFDLCNVLAFLDGDRAATGSPFRLNVGMLPVVAAIERARVPLGIVTNLTNDAWQQLLDRRWGIIPGRFREIVRSGDVGFAKPEPAFFTLATARAGVEPGRIYYVDDTPQHVAAAQAAGWDAERFTSAVALVNSLARRGLNLGL